MLTVYERINYFARFLWGSEMADTNAHARRFNVAQWEYYVPSVSRWKTGIRGNCELLHAGDKWSHDCRIVRTSKAPPTIGEEGAEAWRLSLFDKAPPFQ